MASQSAVRRFQFRLRTLLILVTAFCVVCGWAVNQIRIVRERKSLLDRVVETEGFYVTGKMHVRANNGVRWSDVYGALGSTSRNAAVPKAREWFGDEAIGFIGIPASSSKLAEIEAAFPEATISLFDDKR